MPRRNPDPGGVFEYEDERYVLGHLRAPHDTSDGQHAPGLGFSNEGFAARIREGASFLTGYSTESINQILVNLQAAGDAVATETGWAMTDQGFAKLNGPNGYEPPPISPAQAEAMLASGEIDQDGYAAWKEAYDAYHGTPDASSPAA